MQTTPSSVIHIVQVVRKSSGAVLFDSGLGGLTLADQFLQVGLPPEILSSFIRLEYVCPKTAAFMDSENRNSTASDLIWIG